jgi:hypothetical protein
MALISSALYVDQVHVEHQHQHAEAVRAAADAARAECRANYNHAFATQLTERSRIGTQLSDAQTQILSDVGHALAAKPTADPKVQKQRATDFLKLFSDFDKTTEMIQKNRTATPLPEIPDC